VTAVVPSPKFTVSDSTTIANAIKAYASMTEDVLTTSTNAVKQMKPWRYQLDAPFQLNPNEVHSLRKTLSVGTAASMSRQDIVVVDVALYTMNKTTDLQNLG